MDTDGEDEDNSERGELEIPNDPKAMATNKETITSSSGYQLRKCDA